MTAPTYTATEMEPRREVARRRALESVFAVLALVVPLALRLGIAVEPVVDPDIWWHLAAGRWMSEHRMVPDFDPFMTRGVAHEWLNYSWFVDILFWLGYRSAELAAPVSYSMWMSGLVLLVCAALVRRDGSELVRRSFVGGLGFLAVSSHFGPRTYLFTVLFTGLTLLFIRRCLRGADPWRGVWLVPMFAFWANVHIEFMYALALLGLATFQLWLRRSDPKTPAHRSWKPLALLTVTCAAATLANPFGARLHVMMSKSFGVYGAFDFVSEMQANAFRSPADYLILLLFGGAVATLARRRGFEMYSWGALAGSAYMSFHSQRISWLVCLVALDIAGDHPWLSGEDSSQRVPRLFHVSLPTATGLAVALCTMALLRAHESLVPRSRYPYGAVALARELQLAGPVFNDWNWGGFLRFHLPEVPGNIDGRGPLFDNDVSLATIDTWRGRPAWQEDVDLDRAGFVIANVRTPLAELLLYDSRFRKAFEDEIAMLFVREPKN